ncbi:histidine phosphatase family protein [Bacillus sp. FJAT-53060]|uniref:histidine phosphatase family protein n=1 Tax=Bacillus TaxID=1386 RepID=UPI001CFBD8ED|nr:histidine phosphatase family protein [Bacillus stratosphericus]
MECSETIQGRTDIPLNETGKWQAEQTGLLSIGMSSFPVHYQERKKQLICF